MADEPQANVDANIPFALAPGLAITGLLDFSTKEHIKIFENATKPLEPKFDLQAKNMHVFIGQIRDRTNLYGYNSILTIPVTKNNITSDLNLLDHYGEIPLEQIRAHAKTTWVNSSNRNTQNAFMLFNLLKDSLSSEAKAIIQNMDNQYTIDGKPDGPSLLKIIIMKAHVDTRATSTVIRMNLSSLDTYIQSINSNISTFNEYVRAQVYSLAARGEETQDLLVNLFKAYAVVSDQSFRMYINDHQNRYDDGEELTADQLMLRAENKYKALVERDQWNLKSKEEEQIVALNAEIKKLQLVKKPQMNKNKKGSKNNKKKYEAKDKKKAPNNKKDDWKHVSPKGSDNKTKVIDGVTWHWCPNHKRWVQHNPSECRLKPESSIKPSNNEGTKKVSFSSQLEYQSDSSDDE